MARTRKRLQTVGHVLTELGRQYRRAERAERKRLERAARRRAKRARPGDRGRRSVVGATAAAPAEPGGALGGVAGHPVFAQVGAQRAAEELHHQAVWHRELSEDAGMSGNGTRPIVTAEDYHSRAREAADSADRLRAEAERLAALADDWERRSAEAEAWAVQAGAVEGGLRKSRMTPAEVSKFIRSHPGGPAAGAEAYRQLPR
jgi:hypothetical protein